MYDIAIIGGGLAGLTCANLLSQNGFSTALVEKKAYPFHRVCGEYISNEVVPFLKNFELLPPYVRTSNIKRFQLSSIKGRTLEMPLDLGGFGVSRYILDEFLVQKAMERGADILIKTNATKVEFHTDHFNIELANGGSIQSRIVIGAQGKKSNIDTSLKRGYLDSDSGFIGVKYHIKTDYPKDLVALHNFKNGYCGISAIEDDKYNLCYLASRDDLRKFNNIESLEAERVKKNPFLRDLFKNSDFLFDKPEVINDFTFAPKQLIENHILMAGDAAGLITPLCGNGMALAIHSAKILCEIIEKHFDKSSINRIGLEKEYEEKWKRLFAHRLWVGRQTQKLFGAELTSELAVSLMNRSKWIARQIMRRTHGEPFD